MNYHFTLTIYNLMKKLAFVNISIFPPLYYTYNHYNISKVRCVLYNTLYYINKRIDITYATFMRTVHTYNIPTIAARTRKFSCIKNTDRLTSH